MTRNELLTRINFDIIDYLNEPFNNGTEKDVRDSILTLYELLKENVEWYTTNGAKDGTGATLLIEW